MINYWRSLNLPNKLTLIRVLMIPLFVIFMYLPFTAGRYIALAVFIAASLTDTADGFIARRFGLVTDFGKFMDPLADKLLVCAALICLVRSGDIPAWVVIVIISREFIISGVRIIAADKGIVIAASFWGKIKTICQMVMIIFVLCNFKGNGAVVIRNILIYLSVILTVFSLLDYLNKNRSVLGDSR